MKVKSISIQNFKQFDKLELSFENNLLGEISDRFLILGDNGSGKTTLLQAIALPLALATGKITQIPEFDWTGFLAGRYWRRGAPRIEMIIQFDPEEIKATQAIAKLWYDSQPQEFRNERPFTEPGDQPEITLTLNGDHWKAGNTPADRAQFQGRSYAQRLIQKSNPSIRSHFQHLPGIFWFDQFRNLGSNPTPDSSRDNPYPRNSSTSFEIGVGRLRQYLVTWHQRSNPSDPESYLTQLENLYRTVFPDRRFIGTEVLPRLDSPTEDNTFFLLEDAKHHQYDIAEMSAGEQAIFPILYEFVRQQIAHSIVLIDEIDLNLHPPAAQFLMKQLPRIAPTCQFIVTTHSEAATAVVSSAETYRLAGGALCL